MYSFHEDSDIGLDSHWLAHGSSLDADWAGVIYANHAENRVKLDPLHW